MIGTRQGTIHTYPVTANNAAIAAHRGLPVNINIPSHAANATSPTCNPLIDNT